MITQERLKEVLSYDPETGVFTWIARAARCVVIGTTAGCLDPRGYTVFQIDGKQVMAHRMAWLYVHGWLPPMIDHSNGERSDNRISNLRPATPTQNTANSRKFVKPTTSKWKGVSRSSDDLAWVVSVGREYLGRFQDERDAAEAYMFRALEKYGEYARLQ